MYQAKICDVDHSLEESRGQEPVEDCNQGVMAFLVEIRKMLDEVIRPAEDKLRVKGIQPLFLIAQMKDIRDLLCTLDVLLDRALPFAGYPLHDVEYLDALEKTLFFQDEVAKRLTSV